MYGTYLKAFACRDPPERAVRYTRGGSCGQVDSNAIKSIQFSVVVWLVAVGRYWQTIRHSAVARLLFNIDSLATQ